MAQRRKPRRKRRSPLRRLLRGLLWLGLLVVVLQYVIGAALFVPYPDTDLEGGVDAVVVLSGSSARLPVAEGLMRAEAAPVLVVSDDTGEERSYHGDFCAADHPYEVICRRADPFSTRGESRLVAELARERGRESIAVVTSRYHLLRSRKLFARCTDATLVMRGAPEPWWANFRAIPLEWVKLAVAETTRRGC